MKKIIFIFISWLYSCFHLKQSTKSNSITKVVVCVRWKDFPLMRRHHLQIWSLQSSLQHQNLWLLNRFVFWDDCTCEEVKRLASTDFKSLNLRFTITSSGAIPLDNCLLTLSAYHNFFEINFLTAWFTLIFKDWNLLVKLWGRVTNSKLFFELSRFISSLPWPLKSLNAALVGSQVPSFWLTSKERWWHWKDLCVFPSLTND